MRALPRAALICTAILAALPAHADTGGRWTATSTTAISITGDITVRGNEITFGDGKSLRLTRIEEREGNWTPLMERRPGTSFKLSPPADPVLLNGNALCGTPGAPVTYIVLSQRSERSLGMSVFIGPNPPTRFGDNSCAAYFYER